MLHRGPVARVLWRRRIRRQRRERRGSSSQRAGNGRRRSLRRIGVRGIGGRRNALGYVDRARRKDGSRQTPQQWAQQRKPPGAVWTGNGASTPNENCPGAQIKSVRIFRYNLPGRAPCFEAGALASTAKVGTASRGRGVQHIARLSFDTCRAGLRPLAGVPPCSDVRSSQQDAVCNVWPRSEPFFPSCGQPQGSA